MDIGQTSCQTFKGYIPVIYYEKDRETGEVSKIVNDKNIKKCQNRIVRHLNGTLKNVDEEFVEYYKKYDPDYRNCRQVRSHYGKNGDCLLITGRDVNVVDDMAKPIGIAKSEAKYKTGKAKSFESKEAAKTFYNKVEQYLKHTARRVGFRQGKEYTLKIFVESQYNKKNELKGFNFVSAEVTEETQEK